LPQGVDRVRFQSDHAQSSIKLSRWRKGFVDACLQEMSHKDLLPYLGTSQAVQDLEDFRQAIDRPRSGSTARATARSSAGICARYPDALEGLIIDGGRGSARTAGQYYVKDTRTAESLLAKLLDACDTEPHCARIWRLGASVYDGLAAKLRAAPMTVNYPVGAAVSRSPMNAAILETRPFYALYALRAAPSPTRSGGVHP